MKIIGVWILVLFIMLTGIQSCFASGEWLPEEKVSQDTEECLLATPGFGTNHTGIAVDSNGVAHAVWFSGNPSRVYYNNRISQNWNHQTPITDGLSIARYPSIAIDGNNRLHTAWHDYKNGGINNVEIYYNNSTIGGLFDHETRITNSSDINSTNGDNSYVPTLKIGPDNSLHLLWYDFHWGSYKPEIAYKSAPNYYSWNTSENIDNNRVTYSQLFESPFPSMTVDTAKNIHTVWFDNHTGYFEIYYKKKNASSGLWDTEILLTQDSATCQYPVIVNDSRNYLYVFWARYKNNQQAIFMKSYNATSLSWSTAQQISPFTGSANYPSAAVDGDNNVHLVWNDNRDNSTKVYYRKLAAGTQQWNNDTCVSTYTNNARYPGIAVDRFKNVHVLWQDNRNGYESVYYRQQINATGVTPRDWQVYE